MTNVAPSSAGICAECGKHTDRRYGGEGRYLAVCGDCWVFGPQPVRDLAQAITDGNAFTDADAVRVARAYLDGCGETA